MPKSKMQKGDILASLEDKMKKIKTAVFVNFSGIKVKDIEKLRLECKKAGIDYAVAKKTLLKKALKETGYSEIADLNLSGEVGALFNYGDEVAAAKIVSSFAKDFNNLKVLGGILDGAFADEAKITALAKLPSRPELLAKAIGSLNAPLSGLVGVLGGNIRNLLYALNGIKDKKTA